MAQPTGFGDYRRSITLPLRAGGYVERHRPGTRGLWTGVGNSLQLGVGERAVRHGSVVRIRGEVLQSLTGAGEIIEAVASCQRAIHRSGWIGDHCSGVGGNRSDLI